MLQKIKYPIPISARVLTKSFDIFLEIVEKNVNLQVEYQESGKTFCLVSMYSWQEKRSTKLETQKQ